MKNFVHGEWGGPRDGLRGDMLLRRALPEGLLGSRADAQVLWSSTCRQHVEDEQCCCITLQSAPVVIPAAAGHSKEAL